MTYIQKLAAEHNLKPGDDVIVVTVTGHKGGPFRRLFRYSTASYWFESDYKTEPFSCTSTREPWDGVESVSFDNGD